MRDLVIHRYHWFLFIDLNRFAHLNFTLKVAQTEGLTVCSDFVQKAVNIFKLLWLLLRRWLG